MSPRSSSNRRPDHHSQRSNELGGRQHGSTQRNRNSSYEGSTTDRSDVPETDPNSDRTRGTSPEPSRDNSNMERNSPEDPENRKRKLNHAVTKYLGSSKKFKPDLMYVFFVLFYVYSHILLRSPTSDIFKLHNRARGILRLLGLFIHVRTTVSEGSQLASTVMTASEASSRQVMRLIVHISTNFYHA